MNQTFKRLSFCMVLLLPVSCSVETDVKVSLSNGRKPAEAINQEPIPSSLNESISNFLSPRG